MSKIFNTSGVLRYSDNDRLSLDIEYDFAKYYRSLIPKYIELQPQAYNPHITVVRTGLEKPADMEVWGKYEGLRIPFQYENKVYYKSPYFYMKAHSKSLEEIREELGLTPIRSGYKEFHITIGNTKGMREPRL